MQWLFWGAVGAAGGAAVTVATWAIFSKALDRQFDQAAAQMVERGGDELMRELRTTLDREIPARVSAEMDRKLAEAGITRQTGEQLSRALQAADDLGLIGLRGRFG